MVYRSSLTPAFGLRREIDRLFDDMFGHMALQSQSGWSPAVDIREDDKELSILAELPGMNPEEVEITSDNGILTIRGEKSEIRREGEERRYHLVERNYGTFTRSFQLPQGVDESKIEAGFDNGLLTVRIPKAALPQPKRIAIHGGESGDRRIETGRSGENAAK